MLKNIHVYNNRMSNQITDEQLAKLKKLEAKEIAQKERSGKYWRKYRASHIVLKKWARDKGLQDSKLEEMIEIELAK